MRAEPRWSSTNESGELCLTVRLHQGELAGQGEVGGVSGVSQPDLALPSPGSQPEGEAARVGGAVVLLPLPLSLPDQVQQVLSLRQGGGGHQPGPVLGTDVPGSRVLHSARHAQVLHRAVLVAPGLQTKTEIFLTGDIQYCFISTQ